VALSAIESLSRTSHGVSDTSSSPQKQDLLLVGNSLSQHARENLLAAIRWAYRGSNDVLERPDAVLSFLLGVAARVSLGLLDPNQSLYRTWRTRVAYQTDPEDIPRAMQHFASCFVSRRSEADPVDMAAFVEYEIDGVIHPFADGCGRTARVCSTSILARASIVPPRYPCREEYYDRIGHGWRAWSAYYRTLVPQG